MVAVWIAPASRIFIYRIAFVELLAALWEISIRS